MSTKFLACFFARNLMFLPGLNQNRSVFPIVSPPLLRYVLMIQPSGNSDPAFPDAISVALVFRSPVARPKVVRFCFFFFSEVVGVVVVLASPILRDVVISTMLLAGRFSLIGESIVGGTTFDVCCKFDDDPTTVGMAPSETTDAGDFDFTSSGIIALSFVDDRLSPTLDPSLQPELLDDAPLPDEPTPAGVCHKFPPLKGPLTNPTAPRPPPA
mmetsp:Transcript_27550/g.50190  ORF Transcript_27550/g.50190 Transcript_27550/m.50190 type:complete len:213 (+) Transcript_27550:524-1162(+)